MYQWKKVSKLKILQKGFTLVELLIVISLLGAIALIVIAAINPIEQSNRARDARFKADSSQLLSAIERYYAAKQTYPWMDQTPLTYTGADVAVGFLNANDVNIGICGDTANPCADGKLITGLELLSAFKSRDFITATAEANKIYVGKATGATSSVYSCFIPLAKSVRDGAIASGKVWHITKAATNGTRSSGTSDCTASADWTTVGGGCYVCVPD